MATLKIRQLIDMAIGTPDPGHVNFNALHCLLNCFAEKLEITDETIDYSNYETMAFGDIRKESCHDLSKLAAISRLRVYGGYNPEIETLIEKDQVSKPEVAAPNEIIALEVTEPGPIQIETFESTEEPIPIEISALTLEDTTESIDQPTVDLPMSSMKVDSFIETQIGQPLVPVLSHSPSKVSFNSGDKSVASDLSIQKLDSRISEMEMVVQKISIPEKFSTDISVIKDQLQLVVEQLLLLTFLTLSKKPASKLVQQLYTMAQTLSSMRKQKNYTEKSNSFELDTASSLNWNSSELQLNKNILEEELPPTYSSESKQYNLESHLCYSPEKIFDQLIELKGDFCRLTNIVHEFSERLLQQESQRTIALISEIQEKIRDVKLTAVHLKEQQDCMEIRITGTVQNVDSIKKSIEEIFEAKVDKAEFENLLADKVTYNQLQRKVSLDQMLEIQCKIDKKFSELLRQINENEKKFGLIVDDIQNSLGHASIEGILKTFEKQFDKKINTLQELLQKYIHSTNDECAAAGARFKVLQDLACLSCDTDCTMLTMEKAKVAKLPSAHASNILSPLITYELGSIRKSGIMGYYCKDNFPHAPNAWTKRQDGGLTLKQCVPRHAGGQHTTSTAKERIEKVMLKKK